MENNSPLVIPAESLQRITDAVAILVQDLAPILKPLSPLEREVLQNRSATSTPLIEKIMNLMSANPEFLVPAAEIPPAQRDWRTISALIPISNTLHQLCEALDDTLLQIGAEL